MRLKSSAYNEKRLALGLCCLGMSAGEALCFVWLAAQAADPEQSATCPSYPKTFKKKLRGADEPPPFQSDAGHLDHCRQPEDTCARCKWIRLSSKWQSRMPMLSPEWAAIDHTLMPPESQKKAAESWLIEAFDKSGTWQGVGCVACRAALESKAKGSLMPASTSKAHAARNFAELRVSTVDALQMSNLTRHAGLPHHRASVMRYLGLPEDGIVVLPMTTPSADEFQRVFHEVTTGKAPSSGIDGLAAGKKISKMVFCLYEAKTSMDREFMKSARMCTHCRDERAGRLALRCAATNQQLEQRRFHMSVQSGMGTGATNITKATDKAWKEFSTAHFAAPLSKRSAEKEDFDEKLYQHIRKTHHQLIIDAASDERLSGRQMKEAPASNQQMFCARAASRRMHARANHRRRRLVAALCFIRNTREAF